MLDLLYFDRDVLVALCIIPNLNFLLGIVFIGEKGTLSLWHVCIIRSVVLGILNFLWGVLTRFLR